MKGKRVILRPFKKKQVNQNWPRGQFRFAILKNTQKLRFSLISPALSLISLSLSLSLPLSHLLRPAKKSLALIQATRSSIVGSWGLETWDPRSVASQLLSMVVESRECAYGPVSSSSMISPLPVSFWQLWALLNHR